MGILLMQCVDGTFGDGPLLNNLDNQVLKKCKGCHEDRPLNEFETCRLTCMICTGRNKRRRSGQQTQKNRTIIQQQKSPQIQICSGCITQDIFVNNVMQFLLWTTQLPCQQHVQHPNTKKTYTILAYNISMMLITTVL